MHWSPFISIIGLLLETLLRIIHEGHVCKIRVYLASNLNIVFNLIDKLSVETVTYVELKVLLSTCSTTIAALAILIVSYVGRISRLNQIMTKAKHYVAYITLCTCKAIPISEFYGLRYKTGCA